MRKRLFSLLLCLMLLAALTLPAMAHNCVDRDRNYWCDDCGMLISHKCYDPDKDGWCNYCDCWISHKCYDPDKDSWCNYCNCWIIHTCIDNDKDTFCDLCSELVDIHVHVTVESYVRPDRDVHMVIYFSQPIDTKSVNVWDNPAKYSFKCAAKSSFQLIVSKLKHPARTFSYNTSTEDIYIDTTLYPYGDATQDGKVNVADTSLIYACVKGTGRLADDYANECADVNYDHDLNIADVSKVYAHVKQANPLW